MIGSQWDVVVSRLDELPFLLNRGLIRGHFVSVPGLGFTLKKKNKECSILCSGQIRQGRAGQEQSGLSTCKYQFSYDH